MTLNTTGPISLGGSVVGQSIALELGQSATGPISLNDASVRTLAGIPSGPITMPTNFWGKANFNVDNSLRFRNSASAYLSRTPVSAGNRKTWTWSGWVKRGLFSNFSLLAAGGTPQMSFGIESNKVYLYQNQTDNTYLTSNAVLRDASAWYHIVVAFDSTQSTQTNRIKFYLNGTELATTQSGAAWIVQNTDYLINSAVAHTIGSSLDGYLAEINFIDGQVLTPSFFGENDAQTGVWKAKKYTGTYGTNGFYLPMNVTVETYSIDYLVVAGGGGTGGDNGGGGGGGGIQNASTEIISGAIYTVTVGGGGAGVNSGTAPSGSNSSLVGNLISTIAGGGRGATNGANGGATSGTPQSMPGGPAGGGAFSGGGGAGEAGQVNYNPNGGRGGNGLQYSITGTATFYAGGGGSGAVNTPGAGGAGGGGSGGTNSQTGFSGATNTGGGAGGGGWHGGVYGGSGGSGVVILRMLTTNYSGITTGSPIVTTDGSYTIVRFNSSGSYTA